MSKETREIAEEIAKRITDNPCAHPSCCPHTAKAADAIEKALRDRDERAAKLAEKYTISGKPKLITLLAEHNIAATIAEEVRGDGEIAGMGASAIRGKS